MATSSSEQPDPRDAMLEASEATKRGDWSRAEWAVLLALSYIRRRKAASGGSDA